MSENLLIETNIPIDSLHKQGEKLSSSSKFKWPSFHKNPKNDVISADHTKSAEIVILIFEKDSIHLFYFCRMSI